MCPSRTSKHLVDRLGVLSIAFSQLSWGYKKQYLSVCIFDGRDVGVSEGAMDEPEDEAGLADAPGPEHDDPVVVALLRHPRISLPLPATAPRGR